MNTMFKRPRFRKTGQTLILFTFFMIVLILFVGLGIDLGFAYIARARLSKAVDAACLAGIRNYYLGQDEAKKLATSVFHANYPHTNNITLGINFTKNAFKNVVIDVNASDTVDTFFIRVLPKWKTLSVGSSAEATRAKAILTLVLDRSDSMDPERGASGTMGGLYLPDATISFIDHFDDDIDKAAVATFASTATLNIPMEQPFKTDVIKLANGLRANWTGTPSIGWEGGTFSQGGLTNGLVQNNSVTVAVGEDVIKATVFFTDGLANMIQERFNCPPQTIWNFGGTDAGDAVYFFHYDAPLTQAGQRDATCDNSPLPPNCCTGPGNTFPSAKGGQQTFVRANVTEDAKYRSIQVADEMRANNMYVYAIGMGTADLPFLAQVANATNSSSYDSTKKTGLAFVANDPAELKLLFDKVANDILFRLTK